MGCTTSTTATTRLDRCLPRKLQPTQSVARPHEAVPPPPAVDEKSPVKITIRILRARNLLGKDAPGTSDPYAELTFGHQRFRTDVVPMDCNPVWKAGEFHLDPYFAHPLGGASSGKRDTPFANRFFRIEVFDDDSMDHSQEKRARGDADGADDFLGRVDLTCPLWEHESQKWYLLRQRSKRSRVAGEVEIYVKVEVRVSLRQENLGPPPFSKLALKGRQPLRPYPSSNMEGQDVIVRGRVFNEYFALPQYYCEIRPDALILRLDSQCAPVFVILKCLVTSATIADFWAPPLGNAKLANELVLKLEFALRGYANRIYLQAPKTCEAEMASFVRDCVEMPMQFPTRSLHVKPEYYGSGKEYFGAVYDAMMLANESIFIAGWMLSPEIYLKRDEFPWNSSHRLDTLLKIKAEQGVKVFILIYNDRDVVGVNAAHVVDVLEQRHPNIHVGMHGPSLTKDIYWSHHTKMVVIDWKVCFVGGIDLSVGRYDTAQHPVVDVELPYTWLGSDYYNPRIRALERLDKPFTERFNRHFDPRLPWQDVSSKYEGQIARDCGIYFVHRWTFALMNLGFKMKQSKRAWIIPPAISNELEGTAHASMSVQLLRSFPYWAGYTSKPPLSNGSVPQHLTEENSIYLAMLDQIERAEKFIYIENQFFISSADEDERDFTVGIADVVGAPCVQLGTKIAGKPKRFLGQVQANIYYQLKRQEVKRKREEEEQEMEELDAPLKNAHSNLVATGLKYHRKHRDERRNEEEEEDEEEEEERGGQADEHGGGGGKHHRLGAAAAMAMAGSKRALLPKRMMRFVPAAKDNHGDVQQQQQQQWTKTYIANKIALALYKRVHRAISLNEDFCIAIVLPDYPEGHYKTEPYTRVVMHFQQHSICRGPHSLLGRLRKAFPELTDADFRRYIQFFSLRSFGFVGHYPMQESVYVHSKLMICDDRTCIVGSANINDRSLLGSRDSETAILLEVTPQAAAAAAAGAGSGSGDDDEGKENPIRAFREELWSRHLGKGCADTSRLSPVQCLRETWRERAAQNTEIFESVWPQMPSNNYTKFSEIPSQRPGPYFTIGQLDGIQGFVTEHPMYFLSNEVLTGFDKEGVLVDDVLFQ